MESPNIPSRRGPCPTRSGLVGLKRRAMRAVAQIREKYPWTGEEQQHMRKDMRKGARPARALSSPSVSSCERGTEARQGTGVGVGWREQGRREGRCGSMGWLRTR